MEVFMMPVKCRLFEYLPYNLLVLSIYISRVHDVRNQDLSWVPETPLYQAGVIIRRYFGKQIRGCLVTEYMTTVTAAVLWHLKHCCLRKNGYLHYTTGLASYVRILQFQFHPLSLMIFVSVFRRSMCWQRPYQYIQLVKEEFFLSPGGRRRK